MSASVSPVYTRMPVALCGMMGSGKSAIGRQLAHLLKLPFIDLDARIEQQAGMSVSRIFETEGEPAFRQRERNALQELLASAPSIIGLGGGSLQNEGLLKVLKKNAFLCFIDTPLNVISERVQRNTNRPLLLDKNGDLKPANEINAVLHTLYEARQPLYSQAHLRYVPKAGNSVLASAKALLERLQEV